ncbi:hypothetical protein BC830DRAFT_1166553 [Chytriomyces sp. MP71]|nr:hypothetical protein BC830DRAFT_1166553 [Chytriomyces sp. MP71]
MDSKASGDISVKTDTATTFDMLDGLLESIADEIEQIEAHQKPLTQRPHNAAQGEPVQLRTHHQVGTTLESLLNGHPNTADMEPQWNEFFIVLAADARIFAFRSNNLSEVPASFAQVTRCAGMFDKLFNAWILTLTSAEEDWILQCRDRHAYQLWLDSFRKVLPTSTTSQVRRPERVVTSSSHRRQPSEASVESYPSPASFPSPSPTFLTSPGIPRSRIRSPTDGSVLSDRENAILRRQESRSRSRPRPPREDSAFAAAEDAPEIPHMSRNGSRNGSATGRQFRTPTTPTTASGPAAHAHVHFQDHIVILDGSAGMMARQPSSSNDRREASANWRKDGPLDLQSKDSSSERVESPVTHSGTQTHYASTTPIYY